MSLEVAIKPSYLFKVSGKRNGFCAKSDNAKNNNASPAELGRFLKTSICFASIITTPEIIQEILALKVSQKAKGRTLEYSLL